MKRMLLSRANIAFALGLLVGISLTTVAPRITGFFTPAAQAQEGSPKPPPDLAALRAEVDLLKGKVPDQSHAMKDVGYHFANLCSLEPDPASDRSKGAANIHQRLHSGHCRVL